MSKVDTNFSQTAGLGGVEGAAGGKLAAAKKAAEEFESVFISQLLKSLTSGLEGEGSLSGSESDPFVSMLHDQYGKLIAKTGGIGVSDAILREMIKEQEIEV